MIVTKLPAGNLMAIQAEGQGHRPAGLHVSQIIKSLMVGIKPKQYGEPTTKQEVEAKETKIQFGLGFEQALEAAFQSGSPGSFRPPPVFVPPGIWCSPDSVDPSIWAVEEFKLTWYSAKKEVPYDEVYWPWLVQIKAYCKALDTLLAKLTVLHVNGDYSPPRPWPPQSYGLTFHEMEIEENWGMLVSQAKSQAWL